MASRHACCMLRQHEDKKKSRNSAPQQFPFYVSQGKDVGYYRDNEREQPIPTVGHVVCKDSAA